MSDVVIQEPTGDFSITIPCSPSDFGNFISGLLGKKQVISKISFGRFCIGFLELENFIHLVQQRIKEQNDAKLVSLSIKINYNDGSSVEHYSIEDMKSYSDIKPVLARRASISLIHLLKFNGRSVPERQQIDIDFMFTEDLMIYGEDIYGSYSFLTEDLVHTSPMDYPHNGSGAIGFRIHHTSRTWGADMENLLLNQIRSIISSDEKWRNTFRKWRALIADIVSIFVASGIGFTGYIYVASLREGEFNSIKEKYSTFDGVNGVIARLDSIISYIYSGSIEVFGLVFIVGLLLIGSFGLMVKKILLQMLSIKEPSFLLLSRKSIESKEKQNISYERRWNRTLLFIIFNLFIGVSGNVISSFILK